jgi:hypothetical protein
MGSVAASGGVSACEDGKIPMEAVGKTLTLKPNQAAAAAAIPQIVAKTNLDSRIPFLALHIKKAEPPSPASQTTNAEAIGKATRMQG